MADRRDKLRAIAVVPAYNETEAISAAIAEIRANAPMVDIVVVDDGSTDDTARKAKVAGVYVLRNPFNMGIGATVQTGFKFAVAKGYDAAIQVDGDGQHDPRYIPKMLEIIGNGADVVSGSRFLEKEGFQSSFLRRIGIRFFELLYRILAGIRITDCTSGFRAFGPRALHCVAEMYPDDYPEPEVILMLHRMRLNFAEIPVAMRDRQGGVSSIRGFKPLHYMVKVTLALLMNKIRKV